MLCIGSSLSEADTSMYFELVSRYSSDLSLLASLPTVFPSSLLFILLEHIFLLRSSNLEHQSSQIASEYRRTFYDSIITENYVHVVPYSGIVKQNMGWTMECQSVLCASYLYWKIEVHSWRTVDVFPLKWLEVPDSTLCMCFENGYCGWLFRVLNSSCE
jgi:hypothetical protein